MWAYASVRWRRGLDHRRPTLDGLVESGRGRVFTAAEPLDQLADVKAVAVVAAPTPLRVSNALRTPLWHVAGTVYQGAFFRGMTGGVPLRAFGVELAIAASGRTGLAFAGGPNAARASKSPARALMQVPSAGATKSHRDTARNAQPTGKGRWTGGKLS